MKIRELKQSDLEVVRRIHSESGFDYPLPDLFASEFVRVSVVVDEEDRPVMILPAKKTIEMYLLMDKQWGSPRQRLLALQLAHEDMRVWLERNEWPDVNAWLPPEIERAFSNRLKRLFGWARNRWNSYSRKTTVSA